MAGLFDPPKLNLPNAPNPADTANRLNDALSRRLQTGGVNADTALGTPFGMNGAQAAPRAPTLTGLN